MRPVPHSTALDTPQVHLDHQAFTDVDGALLLNWDYAAELFPVTAEGGLAEIMFEASNSPAMYVANQASCPLHVRLSPYHRYYHGLR